MPSWYVVRLASTVTWVAVLIASSGCSISVSGRSSREMKRDMLDSFLFRSADIFYPQGVPDSPGALPHLERRQTREIEKIYTSVFDLVRAQHARYAEPLAKTLGFRSMPKTIVARLRVTNTGTPVAHIESNGDVSVDVKIAQAIYRATLVAGLQDDSLGGPAFMKHGFGDRREPETEESLIREFLEMKKTVADSPSHTLIGDLVGSGGELDSPWFQLAKISTASAALERHYYGQILFLVSHEIGHGVLGHLERFRGIEPGQCDELQQMEIDADRYAAALLALATPQTALFEEGFAGSAAAGFEDFFKHTYELSGLAAVSSPCGHPDPKQRLAAIDDVYQAIRKGQREATWDAMWRRVE